MAGHKPTFLERQRALETAKNPIRSKFGDQILRNSDDSKLLISRIERIDKYFKRAQRAIENDKKRFIDSRETNRIEPTIIVERGPSVETLLRHHYGEAALNQDNPRYMKSTVSTYKPPSVLPTIDMFVVKRKRKKNTWEDASPGKGDIPVFRSVIPADRLSEDEKNVLHRGWTFHQEAADRGTKNPQKEREKAFNHLPREIKSAIERVKGSLGSVSPLEVEEKASDFVLKRESPPVFITQLYRRDAEALIPEMMQDPHVGLQKSSVSKTVKFSEDIKVQEFDKQEAVNTTGCANRADSKRKVGSAENVTKDKTALPPINSNRFSEVKPRYNNHASTAGSETIAILHTSVKKRDQDRLSTPRSSRNTGGSNISPPPLLEGS